MLPAYGLYGHIRNNNIKSAVLLATFALYIALLWFVCSLVWIGLSTKFEPIIMRLAGHHPTLVELGRLTFTRTVDFAIAYAFVPAGAVLAWFVAAFFCHKAMIRAGTGARPIVRRLEWDLYNAVETLAIAAGLPMPSVEIIETESLNAYASGLGTADATIAVTRGLLEALTKDELEAVLAHELTHIRNRDVRLMMVALIFVGILAFGAQVLGRSVWSRRHGQPLGLFDVGLFVIAGALAGMARLFGFLAQFALSRTREFVADAGAVLLTKKPEALVSALRRISGHDEIPGLPTSFNAMMISSRIGGLFSTHPAVETRIAAIEKYAGGRDMGPVAPAAAGSVRPESSAEAFPTQRPRPNGASLQPQIPFGRRKSLNLSGLTQAR